MLPEILVKERELAKSISDFFVKLEADIQNQRDNNDTSTDLEEIGELMSSQYTVQKNEYRNYITCLLGESMLTCKSPLQTPVVGNRSSMFISNSRLEESFTIHLGSQFKNSHNVRILCADITDLCSPLFSEDTDELCGLNIALGLYSSSLCGAVVLTEPSTANKLRANRKIVRNANLSTEFHFEQIDDQLKRIQEHLKQLNDNQDSALLKPGDFFITKHSNLAQSHVIFHLITDEISSSSEINSRHPVILGLRNILKVASRYDISTLTIPALLRHEMSEEMTVSWCMRRAELGKEFYSSF